MCLMIQEITAMHPTITLQQYIYWLEIGGC